MGVFEGLPLGVGGNVPVLDVDVKPQCTSSDPNDGNITGSKNPSHVEQHEDGEEGTGGASRLVTNVDQRVHAAQLEVVAASNVARNDAANELNHSMEDTRDDENGEKASHNVPST